ncbi:MAG: multiple sugar transport system substrate-binding protein [Actinomycetota bacterium]|nr:multiple sugar transport system substrate-binding protein [Actinomycetota bacterium]
MKHVTRALAVGAVMTITVALAACTPAAGGGAAKTDFPTTVTGPLKAWGFDNADEVGTSRLDYAKALLASKKVTVTMDATQFDAQKFTTLAASGRIPDVVQMSASFVTTYAAKGLILPLDKCYSAHNVDPATRFYPAVLGDVSYQGKVWAVPQFYQPPAIMLNMRVLKAAGVTPDQIDTSKPAELLAAVKAMTKLNGKNPTTVGFDTQATGQAGLWILGLGGSIIDKTGKPTLDNPANTKGIDFLKQINDAQGGYANVKSFTDSFDFFGAKNQFVKDQVGAEVDNQWYVNVLTPFVKSVDIQTVPFRDASGQPFTVSSGTAFVIPAKAKNPGAACAWALALTSEAAWQKAGEARAQTIKKTPGAVNTGLFTGSPAADKALRTQYVVSTGDAGFDQTISTFYDVVDKGQTFGSSPAGQQIQTELQNAVSAVLTGEKTSAQALKDAQGAALRAYQQVAGNQ